MIRFKLLLVAVTLFISSACTTTQRNQTLIQAASTPVGAAIVAKASNKVVDLGLNAGATKIDTGNPYLHSIAVGLRANEGQIVTSADVQKIVKDYGDPAKPDKMKDLAMNAWQLIKSASGKIALSAATELVAVGLQQGAATR
jgi:hypothetical protein